MKDLKFISLALAIMVGGYVGCSTLYTGTTYVLNQINSIEFSQPT